MVTTEKHEDTYYIIFKNTIFLVPLSRKKKKKKHLGVLPLKTLRNQPGGF